MTPQKASILLRAWHKAFKDFGKSNETKVKELLEAADLIDSLAADLEDMTARYKIADDCAKKKGEMNEKPFAELSAGKAERDATDVNEQPWATCARSTAFGNWEWRGVTKED